LVSTAASVESVPQHTLSQLADVNFPLFYMNINANPRESPWRDSIGNAVKLKGYAYTISRPRDLWYASTELVSRMIKFRPGKPNSSGPQ
jgi:hypothetical protein